MAEMANHELPSDEREFVDRHLVELSSRSPEDYDKFQKLVRDLRLDMLRLEPFLHPDSGNSSDSFQYLFGRPNRILASLLSRVREMRKRE